MNKARHRVLISLWLSVITLTWSSLSGSEAVVTHSSTKWIRPDFTSLRVYHWQIRRKHFKVGTAGSGPNRKHHLAELLQLSNFRNDIILPKITTWTHTGEYWRTTGCTCFFFTLPSYENMNKYINKNAASAHLISVLRLNDVLQADLQPASHEIRV